MDYKFLNWEIIDNININEFKNRKPFPFLNSSNLLTEDGYRLLIDNLPNIILFKKEYGLKRYGGQKSHNKYVLRYNSSTAKDIPGQWNIFIKELLSRRYINFVKNITGVNFISLRFNWNYTANREAVYPHIDKGKIATHLFYLNTYDSWNPKWGGQTLVLNDNGKFKWSDSPDFDDFDQIITADKIMGNDSFLFKAKNAWHGVKPVRCPNNQLRKIFSVVIVDARFVKNIKLIRRKLKEIIN